MKAITRIFKALRELGVDVILLGLLEKLLRELVALLAAYLTAVSDKKRAREEKRAKKKRRE